MEVCISTIIEMSRSNTEAGVFVAKFVDNTILPSFGREAQQLREMITGYQHELASLKDRIQKGEFAIFTEEENKNVESFNRKKPTLVED